MPDVLRMLACRGSLQKSFLLLSRSRAMCFCLWKLAVRCDVSLFLSVSEASTSSTNSSAQTEALQALNRARPV